MAELIISGIIAGGSLFFALLVSLEATRVIRKVKAVAKSTVEDISKTALDENAKLNKMISDLKLHNNALAHEIEVLRDAERDSRIVPSEIVKTANVNNFVNELKLIRDRFALEKEKPVLSNIMIRITKELNKK